MAMRGMTPLCSALGRGEQKRALSTRKKSGKKQGLAGTRMTRMKSRLCTPRRSQGRAGTTPFKGRWVKSCVSSGPIAHQAVAPPFFVLDNLVNPALPKTPVSSRHCPPLLGLFEGGDQLRRTRTYRPTLYDAVNRCNPYNPFPCIWASLLYPMQIPPNGFASWLAAEPTKSKTIILACSWTLHHLAPNQVQNRAAAAALVLFVPPTYRPLR